MTEGKIMQTVDEHGRRLTDLENRRREDSSKLDSIRELLIELKTKFELQHTPENCVLKWQVVDHENRVRLLEEEKSMTKGQEKQASIDWFRVVSVIAWIIALIGIFWRR